jgi:plasmid stabilization system protein ParE
VDKSLFHPEAEAEYLHAFEWYEARSPRAALRFESQVDDVLARITATPESFPRYDAVHQFAIMHRFPYSIVSKIFPTLYTWLR